MTIGRIEIDFAVRDEDDLYEMMNVVGDRVMPYLDPHDGAGNCSRWVQIALYEDVDDEYELGFVPDDMAKIEGKLVESLDDLGQEFRANSQWN